MTALNAVQAPHIDWAGLSPLLALFAGTVVVLMVGLLRSRFARHTLVPTLTIVAFVTAIGLSIWQWDQEGSLMSGALALDPLALIGTIGIGVAGVMAVFLSIGAAAPREAAHGEYHALLLVSAAGMAIFCGAQNLITTFIGLELLSIPLYILAATELYRRRSLEAGMKYLIVGSVGSATLLYGFALIFGATGATDYSAIADAIASQGLGDDPLLLAGVALTIVGLAFKASVAPFHQWTPDVYEGAPTPVTAFMATATKVAALIAMLRLFDVALPGASSVWAPALAALAALAMIVGNVGALGQHSMKRLLAFSSIAQAGYMLVGVVVGTQLGAQATVFYVLGYVVMTAASFAVVDAAEREHGHDGSSGLVGLGKRRPLHAVVLSVALLGLAGVPGTVGFVAKLRIVQSGIDGDYTWLAIILVIGSMISFVYYLRVIAQVWTESESTELVPAGAGARSEVAVADREPVAAGVGGREGAAGGAGAGGRGSEGAGGGVGAGSGGSAAGGVRSAGGTGSGGSAAGGGGSAAGSSTVGGSKPPRLRDQRRVGAAVVGAPTVATSRSLLPSTIVAVVAGAGVVVLGVIPGPLMNVIEDIGRAFPGIF